LKPDQPYKAWDLAFIVAILTGLLGVLIFASIVRTAGPLVDSDMKALISRTPVCLRPVRRGPETLTKMKYKAQRFAAILAREDRSRGGNENKTTRMQYPQSKI